MPFLRFSRDKRGYEHTYLIHASHRKGAPARILYWYRTPPGVKVGRAAFDPDVRKALEAQYPGIAFDWAKLMDTTPPPPDVEHWRERRRQEKAARQARQAAERDDDPDEASDLEPSPRDQPAAAPQGSLEPPSVMSADADLSVNDPAGAGAATAAETESGDVGDAAARPRKRRRRGGRRRRRGGSGESAAATPGGAAETNAPNADPGADVDGDVADGDEAPDVA